MQHPFIVAALLFVFSTSAGAENAKEIASITHEASQYCKPLTKKQRRLYLEVNYLAISRLVSIPRVVGDAIKALCDGAKRAAGQGEQILVTNLLQDLEFVGKAESDQILHLNIRSPPWQVKVKIDLTKDPVGQLTCELRKFGKITPNAICDPAPPPAPAP